MTNPLKSRNPDGTTKPVLPVHVLALTMEEAVNGGMPLLVKFRDENPDHFVQVHTYTPHTAHKLLGLRDVDFYAVGQMVGIVYMLGLAKSRGNLHVWDDGDTP